MSSGEFPPCFWKRTVAQGWICVFLAAAAMHAGEAPKMTARQFLQLYRGSMASVASLDVVWQTQSTKIVAGVENEKPWCEGKIADRLKGGRRLTVENIAVHGVERHSSYSCNGKYEKVLREGLGVSKPTGIVDSVKPRDKLTERLVMRQGSIGLVYDPFEVLEMLKPDSAEVFIDEASGMCGLSASIQQMTWVIVADPAKGFLPLAHAWCGAPDDKRWDSDKKAAVTIGDGLPVDPRDPVDRLLKRPNLGILWKRRNGDLVNANGVWFPKRVDQTGPSNHDVYVADSLRVNIPLDDDIFEISFPNGTLVQDKVAGVTYTVGAADGGKLRPPATVLPESESLSPKDLQLRPPASERELEQTFEKVRKLEEP